MKNIDLEHNKPVEKALMEAGLTVEEVVKRGKKTVITVRRNKARKGINRHRTKK